MAGHGGESRNDHFGDAAAKSAGFNVQSWIDDGDTIDEARGWSPGHDDPADYRDVTAPRARGASSDPDYEVE